MGRRIRRKRPTRRSTTYEQHLRSPYWQTIRHRVFSRDNYTCQRCGLNNPGDLTVHHLTYERFGQEHDADLITLCRGCHREEHERN